MQAEGCRFKSGLVHRVFENTESNLNASINIKNLGLIDLNIFTVGTTESYASGRVKITDISKIMSVNSNEGRIPRL